MIVDLDVIQADLFIVKITKDILFLIVDVDEVNQVQIDGYPKVLVLHRLLQHHQLQPLILIHLLDDEVVVMWVELVMNMSVAVLDNEVVKIKIEEELVNVRVLYPAKQVLEGDATHITIVVLETEHVKIKIDLVMERVRVVVQEALHRHQHRHQLQILLHQAVNRMEVSVVYQTSAVVRTVEVEEQQRVDIVAEPILQNKRNALSIMFTVMNMIRPIRLSSMEQVVLIVKEGEVIAFDELEIAVLHRMTVVIIPKGKQLRRLTIRQGEEFASLISGMSEGVNQSPHL